jgi:glycerol-3-phosphate dehydrogenase
VVGAGVVGAAIARELSRYHLTCVLLEAGNDVGTGTSKANTAIWHTGFDAKPGTLEARLVRRGHQLLAEQAPSLGIPLERVGALLVAWDDDQLAQLPAIREQASANGYPSVRPVPLPELYHREPNLGPGATGALEIPDEGIICPFTTPLAFATDAVANGVELRLETRVTGCGQPNAPDHRVDYASPQGGSDPGPGLPRGLGAGLPRGLGAGLAHELVTTGGVVRARWVVNAAGLYADELDRLMGHGGFTVRPRRGQLVVFDKLARQLLDHILLPVPTATTKGVLVAPTVFGNVLLGPTAEDLDDKADTAATADGLAGLLAKGGRILPGLLAEEVTAVYAGLRAATEHADYQLAVHAGQRYACAGGVRSTGLTAALAIAEHLVGELGRAGLPLEPKERVERVRMPNIGEAFPRPYRSLEAVAADPGHGRIVCHCERVTRAELLAATRGPVPARDLDGLGRRTRALLGRCQGFYCTGEVAALFAEATGRPMAEVLGVPQR